MLPTGVRFMLLHGAGGFLTGTVMTALLLFFGPAQLHTLILDADNAPLPLLLLWFFFGLTFGGAQIGAAVMALAEG
ncbi:MAG TPA: hypothetical protein VMB71_08595 [Acetobacteraceae bacterium]|nr:hypothetical protein [Acetobacteraceae bacterium]